MQTEEWASLAGAGLVLFWACWWLFGRLVESAEIWVWCKSCRQFFDERGRYRYQRPRTEVPIRSGTCPRCYARQGMILRARPSLPTPSNPVADPGGRARL